MPFLSSPVITENFKGYLLVREDLYAGGTKRRALFEWLSKSPHEIFSYTGSVFGVGAYALALACHDLGKESVIYISQNKYSPQWAERIDPISTIIWRDPAPLDTLKTDVMNAYPEAHFLEAGFPEEGFKKALISVFKRHTPKIHTIWVSVVSGTMACAMAHAWPDIQIHAVCCTKFYRDLPENIKLYHAPEKYHQRAQEVPPYPSHAFTDAKIWQFLKKYGQKGDGVWILSE